MKRSKELENILDSCLERVFAGETVEDCVRDYPQHAAELRELLETVTGVREAIDITPRPEFRQQAYREFQDAVRDLRPAGASGGSSGFFSLHRWVTTAVAAIAVIVLAGGGTVYAASGSLPDSPLYNVKLATESVRVVFAFSDESKTELYAEFANRRVDEIVAMAEEGEIDGVNRATDVLDRQLIAMADVNNGNGMLHSMATSQDTGMGPGEDTFTITSEEMATVPEYTEPDALPPKPQATSGTEPWIDEPAPDATPNMLGGAAEEDDTNLESGEKRALTAEAPGSAADNELKESVMDDAFSNTMKLEEAKKTASELLQEAIDRAIEIALRGYGIAISNIR